MTLSKRIALIFLAIATLIVAGFFFYSSAQSTNFALPDTPEKQALAEGQARCAGIFHVFRIALKKENPYYEELDKRFGDAYVRHSTMAVKLYFDGEKSRAQIESATLAFGKRLEDMVVRKEDPRAVVDAVMSECQEIELRTLALVERALQAQAVKR